MLENQRDGAVETVREAAQYPGRAQQHGRLGVMTARVHDTVHRGGEGVPGLLLQRQGVQVRAQRHCPTRPWISTVTEVSVGRSGERPKLVSFSTTKSDVACSL